MNQQNTGSITSAVPRVSLSREGDLGEVALLIKQLQLMRELTHDRALLLEFADKLPSLGRYLTAQWLMREVFGREVFDVMRSMLAAEGVEPGPDEE